MIGPRTSIGDRPHWVRFMGPGTAVPDGDGGYTTTPVPLDPPGLFGRVAPATAADMERMTAGTVISTATHLVAIPYHPQVTTQTRVLYTDLLNQEHDFNVVAVNNPEMRNVELLLTCVELVP
jgi:head-tail adaptor